MATVTLSKSGTGDRSTEQGEFTVESGIAYPAGVQSRRYPFSKMDIGDSFLIGDQSARMRISSAASYYGKRNNKKFSIRKIDGELRCWRVE